VNFSLTDEQHLLRKSVREFAETEIRPNVMTWDESQHFPKELLPKLGELGLMGIQFPEALGGAALDPDLPEVTLGGEHKGVLVEGGKPVIAAGGLGVGHQPRDADEERDEGTHAAKASGPMRGIRGRSWPCSETCGRGNRSTWK